MGSGYAFSFIIKKLKKKEINLENFSLNVLYFRPKVYIMYSLYSCYGVDVYLNLGSLLRLFFWS